MRSRIALLILAAFISSGLNVAASSAQAADDHVEMLSYAELQQLPREKQIQYIDGVRQILIDLSKQTDGRFSDSDLASRSKLRAWLERLDREISTAHAAGRLCSISKECREQMYSCLRQRMHVGWNAEAAEYECNSADPITIVPGLVLSEKVKEYRKRAFLTLSKSDPRFEKRAPNAKSPAMNLAVDPETMLPANKPAEPNFLELAREAQKNSSSALSKNFALPDKPPSSTPGDPKLLNPVSASPEAVPAAPPAPVVAEVPPAPVALIAEPEIVSESSNYDDTMVRSATQAQESTAAVSSEEKEEAPPEVKSAPVKRAKSKASFAAPKMDISKFTCAPKPEVCEAPEKNRSKIYQGSLSCVFAGMVSKLDTKNRKCAPVTDFKLGSSSYSCSSGQTMCNPMLFGTVNASKAICVGRGNNVTEQCAKISSAHDAQVFLNRHEAGIQDKWDEFRREFANVCKAGTIQAKFHCAECNTMKTRLFELHARIVGDPCKPGVQSLDSAVKSGAGSRGGRSKK